MVKFWGALHEQSGAICLSDGCWAVGVLAFSDFAARASGPPRVSLGENVYERISVPPWAGSG
jgi:hypothetical protein